MTCLTLLHHSHGRVRTIGKFVETVCGMGIPLEQESLETLFASTPEKATCPACQAVLVAMERENAGQV